MENEKDFENKPEYVALILDIKRVWRDGIKPKDKDYIKSFCQNRNLFIEFSEYKIPPDPEPYFSGESYESILFWAAKNQKDLMEVKKLDDETFYSKKLTKKRTQFLHKKSGQFFGYPECCINFLLKENVQFKKITTKSIYSHYILKAYENSQYHSLFLNSFLVAQGLQLIVHQPCSYNCKSSIKIAKMVLNYYKERNPYLYNRLLKILKCPIIYFEDKKRILIHGFVKQGDNNSINIYYKKLIPLDMKVRISFAKIGIYLLMVVF